MTFHNLNNYYKKTQTLYLAIVVAVVIAVVAIGYYAIGTETQTPASTRVTVATTSLTVIQQKQSIPEKPTTTIKTEIAITTAVVEELVCIKKPIAPDKLAETHPKGNPCSPVAEDATCVSIGSILVRPEDVKGSYWCTPTYQ